MNTRTQNAIFKELIAPTQILCFFVIVTYILDMTNRYESRMDRFAAGKSSWLGVWMDLLVECKNNVPAETVIVND